MKKRKVIIVLFCIPLAVLAGFLIKKFYLDTIRLEKKALQISKKCTGHDRGVCLNEKIISYITQSPEEAGVLLETFWELSKEGKITDDPRIFSDVAHYAGMKLIKQNVSPRKAVHRCGSAFKQGCVHGAIMEYLDHADSPGEVEKLFAWCKDISGKSQDIHINCLHGVGHTFAAKNSEEITKVVHFCDPLVGNERSACVS